MKAKDFLLQNGISYTALRRDIIQMMLDNPNPLSCDDIVKKVHANKTTIYRILYILEEKDLILQTQNHRTTMYRLKNSQQAYFICDKCCKIEAIKMPKLKIKNIKSITVKGICNDCC